MTLSAGRAYSQATLPSGSTSTSRFGPAPYSANRRRCLTGSAAGAGGPRPARAATHRSGDGRRMAAGSGPRAGRHARNGTVERSGGVAPRLYRTADRAATGKRDPVVWQGCAGTREATAAGPVGDRSRQLVLFNYIERLASSS